jgi:hypothetical protein
MHDGFVCSVCGHCALNFQDTMKRHFREDHAVYEPGQGPLMATPGPVQQLFFNTKEPFFAIREVDDHAPKVDPWSLFKLKVAEVPVAPPLAQAPENKELSQMLRHTLWAEHVKGLDLKALSLLTAGPSKGETELLFLQQQVIEYFEDVVTYKAQLPRLLLQHLNCTNEAQ